MNKSTINSLMLFALFTCLASAERPNFLFILADDLGCRDLSVEGSTFYESPHIDSIANGGMRFTQGYATCQVCSPSRASIMTGQFAARHGITDWIGAANGMNWKRNGRILPANYKRNLPHEDTSLAEAFKNAGYATFFAGKWHLGGKDSFPEDHGFDINKGGFFAGSPRGGYFSPYKNPRLENLNDGQSLPVRLAEETAQFISDQKDKDKPFLAYLAFYSVHSPIQTSQPLWEKYRKKAGDKHPSERFIIDGHLPIRQVQDNPIYAGMIESMDNAVGVALKALEDNGFAENTIVIFTSDNGGVAAGDASPTTNLPFRGGKGRQWEGGIREPFYIKAPGVTRPGSISETPVTGADFYPTLLNLAGLDLMPEQHVDGQSLVPLMQGNSIEDRALFWHYPHYGNQGGDPSSIIRRGDWKLIHYWEDGHDELYNLANDEGEQHNVAADHPETAKKLRIELQAFLLETDARIPIADARFDAEKAKERLIQLRGPIKERLEKQHANFLKPDWKPNKTWWGSMITAD